MDIVHWLRNEVQMVFLQGEPNRLHEAADLIEELNERVETLRQVVRDQHQYGVEQLLEMEVLKEALLAIKQESNEENIREIAHQAL